MDLPKYHETFLPILEVLANGEILHHRELGIRVRDRYYSNIPKELFEQKTSTGANSLLDRIGWGKSYLKLAKFVEYPQRGMVQISEKGKEILSNGRITLDDIQNDPDFISHRENQKNKKESSIDELPIINNSTPQELIDSGFSMIESQVKSELLERLKNIDPYYFEKVILILLNKMGYGDFIETAKSGDGGIDGIINEDKLGLEKIYMQAKRYNDHKVRETDIRNFIGAMSGDTSKGIFVTTSSFDESATKKAQAAHHKIILVDGIRLVDLMYQYGVGIQVRNTYEIKELDEDFFE